VFEAHAKIQGIKVLGHEAIDPGTKDYGPLLRRIGTSNDGFPPDAIYASTLTSDSAIRFLKDKVAILGWNTKVKFMGPAGIQTQALIDGAGTYAAEGVYSAVTGLPYPDSLGAVGKQFITDYEGMYGDLTEPTAIYGYEAMNVLLKAIENVCASGGDPTDRKQVRDALFAIHDFTGALGTWSFDPNGDTTLREATVYEVKDGAWQLVKTYK
jgi:branched-chain amino acid transport system substrate-binding protein